MRSGSRIGWVGALAVVLIGVAASTASAQGVVGRTVDLLTQPWTDHGYFNVNFARQRAERSVEIATSFPLYDETATFGSRVTVDRASVTDFMGGVRVWRNLAVGVGFSQYKDPTSATYTASVPDPLFFDRPHVSSGGIPGQQHTEKTVYLSALWMIPIRDNLDVAVFAGPSFVSLDKDFVTGITVAPGTADIASFTTSRISESSTAVHFGIDIRYTIDVADVPGIRKAGSIVRKVGIGVFARFSGGSVDSAFGTIDVGGTQYGVGLRIGF